MKILCAWCKRRIGTKQPYDDKTITHGMCRECFEKGTEKKKMSNLSLEEADAVKNEMRHIFCQQVKGEYEEADVVGAVDAIIQRLKEPKLTQKKFKKLVKMVKES